MKYRVEYNHCNCHPETCCCNPYKVVNTTTGEGVATFYLEADAQKLCNLLNK